MFGKYCWWIEFLKIETCSVRGNCHLSVYVLKTGLWPTGNKSYKTEEGQVMLQVMLQVTLQVMLHITIQVTLSPNTSTHYRLKWQYILWMAVIFTLRVVAGTECCRGHSVLSRTLSVVMDTQCCRRHCCRGHSLLSRTLRVVDDTHCCRGHSVLSWTLSFVVEKSPNRCAFFLQFYEWVCIVSNF